MASSCAARESSNAFPARVHVNFALRSDNSGFRCRNTVLCYPVDPKWAGCNADDDLAVLDGRHRSAVSRRGPAEYTHIGGDVARLGGNFRLMDLVAMLIVFSGVAVVKRFSAPPGAFIS